MTAAMGVAIATAEGGLVLVLLIVLLAGAGGVIAVAGRFGQQRAWARAEAEADLDERLEEAMRLEVDRNLARLRREEVRS